MFTMYEEYKNTVPNPEVRALGEGLRPVVKNALKNTLKTKLPEAVADIASEMIADFVIEAAAKLATALAEYVVSGKLELPNGRAAIDPPFLR